jgi:homoserine dehydrogenase
MEGFNMATIKIGFLGLGVVGAELVNIIRKNTDGIYEKYGIRLEVSKIFVRDAGKKRSIDTPLLQLTTNAQEVVDDPDTDIICECMGGAGTEETRSYALRAIGNGKSVVLSSKKVLALYGMEILESAGRHNTVIKFDATVGGGIPVAKIIKECFKGEEIRKVVGILNATSNFIYSKMEKEGLSFEDALKKAQELGYAENDPTEDIGGWDALYKSVILVMFSMKKWVDIRNIKVTPFSNINVTDIKYANELGYQIKPLVIVENGEPLVYRIGPCLIRDSHIAANTFHNNNMIVFEGSNSGVLGFYGQGAGSKPTASAMFDDLIGIVTQQGGKPDPVSAELYRGISAVRDLQEHENNLYWRISVDNRVGMFAAIATILARNSVNIEKIIQKDEQQGKMGIVLLTSSVNVETISRISADFEASGVSIHTVMPFLGE